MQIHTHLFLVYGDMLPNITPALDPTFRPSEVFLLSSQETIEQAERLELILQQAGVHVSYWPLDDLWNIEHIRERILEFITTRVHGDIALNATGGTKPMSLAAYEMFCYADKPVYYVHPERDYVVWLHPRTWPSFDLADKIKLPAYFTAHGMRLVSCNKEEVPAQFRTLTELLVKNVARFSSSLSILNALASFSEGDLISPPLDEWHLNSPEILELIDLLTSHGLLEKTNGNRLRFPTEEARFYVNGGWLEEHVYGVLFKLRQRIPAIQDMARNIKVEWDTKGSPVANEIDVAFLADNRLYLIECKTKNFAKDRNPESSASDILYKLDTLRDYLGDKGSRAMVVSYRILPKAARLRAEEFNIKICDHEEIQNIDPSLKKWILDRSYREPF